MDRVMPERNTHWLSLIVILALVSGRGRSEAAEAMRFVVVHSVSGNIEPCGCGENLSGGWAALIGQIRGMDVPLINGGNFLEGGALDRITARSLRHSGLVDGLVCLGPDDILSIDLLPKLKRPYVCASIAEGTPGIAPVGTMGAACVTSIVDPPLLSVAGGDLADAHVALDRLVSAMRDGRRAGVLFLYARESTRDRLFRRIKKSKLPILVVDCLPRISMSGTWALGAGTLVQCAPAGRELLFVEIRMPPQATSSGSGGRAAAETVGASVFRTTIEKTSTIPTEAAESIVREYDGWLKELVDEKASLAGFLGSRACRQCHATEFETWSKTGHARAMEPLGKAGKATQVRCYMCHITSAPLERATSVLPPLPANKDLQSVGCESCHGPGEKHAKSESASDIAKPSSQTCTQCHTKKLRLTFSYDIDIERATCQKHRAR